MSWRGNMYGGILYPFRRHRDGGRDLRRMLRGIGRGARPQKHRRSCCCCPLVLVLGLAGFGLIAGSLYVGIRFLGWA
jgi:hypothetical protein